MRIVAGKWKGRAILAPEGSQTRPTTDRLRESLASIVLSARGLDLSHARVLDAFAGSGALGLELLSRGAEEAVFIERSARAKRAVERNVRELGAPARVIVGDAWSVLSRPGIPGAPFDVVLLDPPYATPPERLFDLICLLEERGALAHGALIAHERAERAPALDGTCLATRGFIGIRSRTIGQSAIDLWRYDGETSEATVEDQGD